MSQLAFKPLFAAGLLLGLASAASADVTLTVSSWLPAGHLLSRAQADWCGEVTKATASRVKCNILPKRGGAAARHLRRGARRPGRPVLQRARLHPGPLHC